MNTYYKYAPNVFLAKCDEKHEKGEEILVTTKYGKENESIVFNLVFERDGFYYYSIVRADGFNVQEWAKRRAERRREWAASAERKSREYYEKSNKDADFLSLENPLRSVITVSADTGKQSKILGTTWVKVLSLAIRLRNTKIKPHIGTQKPTP